MQNSLTSQLTVERPPESEYGENKSLATDKNGISVCLSSNDNFYEGAYTATANWLPKRDNWFFRFPLVLLNSGYVRQVCNNVKKNSTVLELGCGGGIAYFNSRFNMIGLDVSYASLLKAPYPRKLQARAESIPLANNSVDAVISCSFWEHIDGTGKEIILKEIYRVLRPGGKLIFFYDVQTENRLIDKLKRKDSTVYARVFLEKDGHVGYHTPSHNAEIFEQSGFKLLKHFGKERTNLLALSAVQKLIETGVIKGYKARIYTMFNRSPYLHFYYLLLHVTDNSIGRLYSISKSRVMLTIAQKS